MRVDVSDFQGQVGKRFLRLDKGVKKEPQFRFIELIVLMVGASVNDLGFQKVRVIFEGELNFKRGTFNWGLVLQSNEELRLEWERGRKSSLELGSF